MGSGGGGLRGPVVMSLVLEPWLDELLVALKTIVTAAWEGKGGTDSKQADGLVRRSSSMLLCVHRSVRACVCEWARKIS